jgi:hypothetical protein
MTDEVTPAPDRKRIIVTNLPQYAAFFPSSGNFKFTVLGQLEVRKLSEDHEFYAYASDEVGLSLLDQCLGKEFPLIKGKPPAIDNDFQLLICEANLKEKKSELFVPNQQPEVELHFMLIEKV